MGFNVRSPETLVWSLPPNPECHSHDMWPILSKWDSSVHMVKIELLITKVYILPFIMMVNILKMDNPKRSFDHWGIEKYEMEKSAKSAVYHWVNGQMGQKSSKLYHLCFKFMGQKSSKLYHLCFKFWSKTFTVDL